MIDLPVLYSGKVRDVYDAGDNRLLLVASDRMSAFDVVMAETIPMKGAVLVALDAVDVAMTEASVGAGVSTVLLISALALCRTQEARPTQRPWLPLAVALTTGALIVYGTLGLPSFSDPEAPIHRHVVPRYLEQGPE